MRIYKYVESNWIIRKEHAYWCASTYLHEMHNVCHDICNVFVSCVAVRFITGIEICVVVVAANLAHQDEIRIA